MHQVIAAELQRQPFDNTGLFDIQCDAALIVLRKSILRIAHKAEGDPGLIVAVGHLNIGQRCCPGLGTKQHRCSHQPTFNAINHPVISSFNRPTAPVWSDLMRRQQ